MFLRINHILGATVAFLLTLGSVLAQSPSVSAPGLTLQFNSQGSITNCLIGTGSVERSVTGGSSLTGFTNIGVVQVQSLPGGGYEFIRSAQNAQGKVCTLSDSFTPTSNSIRWVFQVFSTNSSWTAPLILQLQYPVSSTTLFWTPWVYSTNWVDPLVPQSPTNSSWNYGNGAGSICIPMASMLEPENDIGLSMVVSPAQPILQLVLSNSSTGLMQFQHSLLRLGNSSNITFTADIVAHEADWRGGLRWMTTNYAAFFDPPNPAASMMAGCGTYSQFRPPYSPAEAARYKQMAYRVNWNLGAYFPYFGMWMPPEPNSQTTWQTCGRDAPVMPMSYSLMDQESILYKTNGFFMLNYFNVTEFGQNIGSPSQVNTNLAPADQWEDPTTFIYTHLSNAIVRSVSGSTITSWANSLVVDPGDPGNQAYAIQEAQLHAQVLPDSAGICIDRMDWLQQTNFSPGADDGVGWYGGRVGRYLGMGWLSMMNQIGPIMHNNGKIIMGNAIWFSLRLDFYSQLDGVFNEYGYYGHALNGSCLIAIHKPAIMWTLNPSTVLSDPDPDDYFQRHLYMGAYPMAPDPYENHSITPNPITDQYYLDYGPLLDAMRGKQWVLQPHCVQTATAGAKVNLFQVPGGYALPVTFGGASPTATVTVQNVPGLATQHCPVLYPGAISPSWVMGTVSNNVMQLQVPLVRGCAMVTISTSAPALFYKGDNGYALNQSSSWTNNTVPGTNSLLVWDNSVINTTGAGLGGNLGVAGLSVMNPGVPFAIGSGDTLALGGSGIDMSQATTNFTINSLVALGAAQNWVVASNLTLTVGGTVSGSSALNQFGAGAILLTASNTCSGAVNVSQGTLALSGQGSLAAVPSLSLANNATFNVSTVDNPFVLGGGQTLSGVGMVLGNFTAESGATLAPGVLGNPGVLAFSNNLTLAGAILDLPLSTNSTAPGAGFIQMSGGTLNLSGTNLVFGSSFSTAQYALVSGAGSIVGNAANFMLGSGNSGRQSAAFDTTSTPGCLLMKVTSPLLVWTGTNGGNWDITTTNWNNAGLADKFWNMDCVQFDDTSTNGTVNVVTNIAPGQIIVSNNAVAYTIGGAAIDGGATLTLLKSGAGTLTLSAQNTLGGTTVNGGTLVLPEPASGSSVGFGIICGPLTINNGATVNAALGWALGYSSASVMVPSITISNGTLIFAANGSGGYAGSNITMTAGVITGATPDWYSGITPNPVLSTLASSNTAVISSGFNLRLGGSNLTMNVSEGATANGIDLLVSGPITAGGGGGIVKNGLGTLVLGNTGNTYTDGTTVNGGTLVLTNANGATGDIRGTLTINIGGTVVVTNKWALGYDTAGAYVTNIVINGGTLDFTGDAATDLGGTAAYNITMTGGTIASLSGTVPPDLFNGGSSGTVLNSLPANTSAIISSGFNLRLAASTSLTLNVAQGSVTNGVDLLINGPLTGGSTTYSVIKTGAGTAQFRSANTYTCPTIVSNGTLLITGSTSANSPVSVYGGMLGGANGIINGPVTIYGGGTLAVGGPSIGTMTIGNTLTLNAGSTNYLRISKTGGRLTNDRVSGVGGNLTFAGSLTITNATSDGTPLAAGDSFTLFPGTGGYAGNFAATNLPVPGNGLAWNWDPATAVLSVVTGPTLTAPVLSGERPLTFSGPSNQTYEVLSTTNLTLPLADWTVLTNGTFGATPVVYTDTTATNKTKFYLIKSP
jgi:autotransporter-associated beta strand protein